MDANFLTVLLVFILGFVAGWHLRTITMLRNMIDNPDEIIKVMNQLKEMSDQEKMFGGSEADLIEMKIENHQGLTYAYDKHTGEFIAQGDSLENMLASAKQRFPNKRFRASHSD